MSMTIIPAYDYSEEIGVLFSEYMEMMITKDHSLREYMFLQKYNKEMAHM